MVQFFKWLVKIAMVVWIIIIVIAVIGCYTTPEKDEPSIEVRDKTKEKTVDISFFKWIRSKGCAGEEVTGQGHQDLTEKVRVVESSVTV